MKKHRKLNLKKINIANINYATTLKGGVTGNTLDTLKDCPITEQLGCNTTIIMGSREIIDCAVGGGC